VYLETYGSPPSLGRFAYGIDRRFDLGRLIEEVGRLLDDDVVARVLDVPGRLLDDVGRDARPSEGGGAGDLRPAEDDLEVALPGRDDGLLRADPLDAVCRFVFFLLMRCFT